MVLNICPMKPSGVQFARPILPPRLQTRSQLSGGAVLVGREHHAEGRDNDIEAAIRERQASASASWKLICRPFGGGALTCAIKERGHVVRRDHVAPTPRGGERGVAVAGGDVEHVLVRAEVERLAQRLADDLQRGADDGIVARRPGALLAGLDGPKVGFWGCGILTCQLSDTSHVGSPFGWLLLR